MSKVKSTWKEAKQDELKANARASVVYANAAQLAEEEASQKGKAAWKARIRYMLAASNERHTRVELKALFDEVSKAIEASSVAYHRFNAAISFYSDCAEEYHKLKDEIEAEESASLPDLNDTKLFNAPQ